MLWLLGTVVVLVAWFLVSRRITRGGTSLPARPLPPELDGGEEYGLAVVGESHYQRALERACGVRTEESAEHPVTATLVCEDSNPYDDEAVRVDVAGRTVGYLSRDKARRYRMRLADLGLNESPTACPAMIMGGWNRGGGDMGHYGVALDVRLAKSRRRP